MFEMILKFIDALWPNADQIEVMSERWLRVVAGSIEFTEENYLGEKRD